MTGTTDYDSDAQQAFVALSRIDLSDDSLASVMSRVAELTKRTIPGASDVSVTLLEHDSAGTVAATGALAVTLDERQYERGYGPCLDSAQAGELIEIIDMASETRWADYCAEAVKEGVRSSLSVPVPLQREVSAVINIYGTEKDAFNAESRELAERFAAQAAVGLANMHLYEGQAAVAQQLRTAMASRAVIEQAKGILMGARRCSASEAFNILVELSQHANEKLRVVAEELVREVSEDASPQS